MILEIVKSLLQLLLVPTQISTLQSGPDFSLRRLLAGYHQTVPVERPRAPVDVQPGIRFHLQDRRSEGRRDRPSLGRTGGGVRAVGEMPAFALRPLSESAVVVQHRTRW